MSKSKKASHHPIQPEVIDWKQTMGVISDDEDEFGIPAVPWLHLLPPEGRAWRENQHLKGRDPDHYLEQQLRDAGQWPPNPKPTKKGK